MQLNLKKPISRITNARWYYQQRNVPNPFEFNYTENTITGYRVGIKLGNGMILSYIFRFIHSLVKISLTIKNFLRQNITDVQFFFKCTVLYKHLGFLRKINVRLRNLCLSLIHI